MCDGLEDFRLQRIRNFVSRFLIEVRTLRLRVTEQFILCISYNFKMLFGPRVEAKEVVIKQLEFIQ